MAEIQVGANFEFLLNNVSYEKCNSQTKQGFILEGGSGSGKTWDTIQFLMMYSQDHENCNKDILISRNTYADVKKTVLKDFIKILKLYGLYNIKNHYQSHPQSYRLFGNIFFFTGLDGMGSHGERHDVVWINEAMETEQQDFQQLNQRCNEFFILDYNPNATHHWIFNSVETRPDTKIFKSTQLMNPFLPKGQRDEILAYEPTPTNIKNGTADEFMWNCYGLGLRSASKGIIFKHVNYIDEFPVELRSEGYGLDFGYTNDPTALSHNAIINNKLYTKELIYEPLESPELVVQMLIKLKVKRHLPIYADSNDPESIKEIREAGFNIIATKKYAGSIREGISLIKKYQLNIFRSINYKREQENYKWREINGIMINEPIDKHNHLFDSLRYYVFGVTKENRESFKFG